ncbi:DEAD/DEAH box helicase [Bifidobacterium olomucense]|uniref:DEAD/DEAH box helicase n=1 Tax=Bifidobacterium olomucense TaxID=2675324 RepID=UPI003AA81749
MPYNDLDDAVDAVTTAMTNKEEAGDAQDRPVTFGELGVPGPLVRSLAQDGKKTAFPIQADTLPDSLAGRDVLGRGRTGSGKTLAFSIPLVARLGSYDSLGEVAMAEFRREMKRRRQERLEERRADDFLPHPRGLVLAPTRELANQINDVVQPLARTYGMTTTTVYGGVKYARQIRDLKAGADIVVACPGRLEDLLHQQALTLASVEVVVIDEADEMADMGFLPPVKRLLEQIRPDAQHMLFSATLDHGVDEVVNTFLHDPKVHSVDPANSEPDLMTHHVFETTRADKHELVRTLASGKGRRILFTRTKFQAKKLAKNLTQSGIPAAELHGNLNQNQRDRNMAAFDSGDVNVMVATDVAARGIDVGGVELVVQVEPPDDPKSFVHRSGRTARAGKAGDVVTLVLPEQRRETRRLLNQAGIKTKPVAVTHDSPEVLELVGERAEKVEGWSLEQSQPVGGRRNGGQAKRGSFGTLSQEEREERERRLEQEKNARKKERRRRRAAERAARSAQADANAESNSMHDNASERARSTGERRAQTRQERKGKNAVAESRGRNRAERRAGLSNPQAERRDYLFEHPEERRGGNPSKRDERRRKNNRQDSRTAGTASGDKRIHRKNENRIISDERGEAAKRHDRRMMAKYGNTEGPHRRHSKIKRVPFRSAGKRSGR